MLRVMTVICLLLKLVLPAPAEGASLSAELRAVLQENPSVAGALADFDRLLAAAGVPGKFDPASVEIRIPGENPLPARVAREEGIYRVSWLVPAAASPAQAGDEAVFELRFGPSPGRSPALEMPENMLPDGGFRVLDENGIPPGITPAAFRLNYAIVEGSEGGNALSFKSDSERSVHFLTPWVRAREGTPYEYLIRYRTSDARAHHYSRVIFSFLNYRDAEGKRLPRRGALVSWADDTGGWLEYRVTAEPPAGTVETSVEFHSASSVPGSVILDEVRILPARTPEVMSAKTPGGGKFRLTAGEEGILRFDLGTAGSPVMEGFRALSPETGYTGAAGFGFLSASGARDTAGYTDHLSRDLVAQGNFRADLPDGSYRLWLLTGDSQTGSTMTRFYFDQSLSVNGREVYRDDTAPAEFFRERHFRHYDDFWVPGMDYYDTFVAGRFREHHFEAKAENGRLEVSWRNLPVCAMVIFPADRSPEMEVEIDWLRGRRRRDTSVRETAGPAEEAVPANRAEQRRGLVLFRRPANELVYPSSRPREGERIERLGTFGTPGQTASAHFSIYPLRDLGEASVVTGDLRSGRNAIPAGAVEARVVRSIFKRLGRGAAQPTFNYRVTPFLLDRRDGVPLSGEASWSWYILVNIPEGTPAGTYTGEVRIVPRGARRPLAVIPLSVEVLPFTLQPLQIAQGYYYFPSEPWYAAFWGGNMTGPSFREDPEVMEIIEQNERREMRFMKSFGFNSLAIQEDMRGDLELVDGEVKFTDNNRLAWWMDIYASEGMGPMPYYGFSGIGAADYLGRLFFPELGEPFTEAWNRAYRSIVREGMRLQEERGWPEILWYISDELSNYREEGAARGVKLARLLADIPGARILASMNGPYEHIMVPHLDISMPNFAFPVTGETVEMVRGHGSDLWLYNIGLTDRLTYGLYPWRVRAGGRFQWHYRGIGGDQWDDGAGNPASAYAVSFNSPREVVPGLWAQAAREGVYDHRYAVTLEKSVEKARANPAFDSDANLREKVRVAQQLIEHLEARIPVDIREAAGFRVDPRSAGEAIGGEFRDTDNIDRVRWSMARMIVELEEAIAGGR